MPIAKLSQFVSEVIVIEGPASASIFPTRCRNGNSVDERAQQCRKINTSSTPIANTRNGTTVTIGKNSKPNQKRVPNDAEITDICFKSIYAGVTNYEQPNRSNKNYL